VQLMGNIDFRGMEIDNIVKVNTVREPGSAILQDQHKNIDI
jgi:hypothetical protein